MEELAGGREVHQLWSSWINDYDVLFTLYSLCSL